MKPIKPGSLCMIRLRSDHPYVEFCGTIVIATEKRETVNGTAWNIEPHLYGNDGQSFWGVLEANLFPLDNPSDDEIDVHSTRELVHD